MINRQIKHHLGNILRGMYAFLLRRMGVEIGSNTMISLGAKIDVRRGKVIIGNNCIITHGSVILSHDATAGRIDPSDKGEGTTILEDNVFVGVNSVILRNVRIGRNSIIGAGTVVTKDVPPNVVVAGNPMNVVREIKEPNSLIKEPS